MRSLAEEFCIGNLAGMMDEESREELRLEVYCRRFRKGV